MSWGAVTFTPNSNQLNLLDRLDRMKSIRIQGSRSHADIDQVRTSITKAKRLDHGERYKTVAWGPMDGASDYSGLDHYVRNVLSTISELPDLVVFDAELLDERFALHGPDGTPVHYYNLHVLPAIAVAQSYGIPTAGPGTTHTKGEDDLGYEVLENIIRSTGINADYHTPSFHWYVDRGWDKSLHRLRRLEDRVRTLGWDRAHITETGAHGAWLRSLDGWGCGKDTKPTEERQRERVGRIKEYLWPDFWQECYCYQFTEDWSEPPDRHYGLYDPQWNPKLVTGLWTP